MSDKPNIFEIDDPETGKKYRIEADPGVPAEQALAEFDALDPAEWSAFEYNPEPSGEPVKTPAPAKAPATAQGQRPTDEVQPLSAWEANEIQQTAPTIFTKSQVEIPELRETAEKLFAEGVRDPAAYNEAYRPIFEQYGLNPAEYEMTPEIMGNSIKRDAAIRARQIDPTGFIFGPGNFDTGVVDPEAPETVTGSLMNSAIKSVQNTGNALAVGLPAQVASMVGADETATELGDKYVRNQAAINYERPDAVGDLSNLTLGNAAQYGAEAIGSLAADIGTGGLGGFGVKALAKGFVREAAESSIQRKLAEGIPLQIAENLAAREAAKTTSRLVTGAVTTQSVATETGSIAGDTYRDTGTFSPVSTLIAGVLSGSLDSILPTRFLQNVGIAGDVTRQAFGKKLGKALTEGVKSASIEGGTEALQTFIGNMPETWITGKMPDDILDQMANAFVQGAIGGLGVGATSAASTKDYTGPKTVPLTEREQTIVAPTGRRNSKKYREALGAATVRGQEIVDEIVGGWENKPNVQVLDNFKGANTDPDALGVYRGNGTIILNSEAIIADAKARNVSPDTVIESVLFHEALGHYGLESLYRDNLDAKLTQFYNEGSPTFVAMVDTWIENNPGAYTDSNGQVNIARVAEEVLAEMSEKGSIPRSMVDELINMLKDFMRNMGLADTKLFKGSLQYSERELRTIVAMGQAKVVAGEQADLNTGTPSDKYMYIGRQELENNRFRGTGTEWNEALLNDLDATQDSFANEMMLAEPEDRPDIFARYSTDGESRQNTGWFIGPDNKWRFEISDSEADFIQLPAPGEKLPLSRVLYHPELYELYQNIGEDIEVTTRVMPSHKLGSFNKQDGLLTLNAQYRDALLRNRPEDREMVETALGVLLHEVQHGVQGLEGFAVGGSPPMALQNMPDDVLFRGAKNHAKYLKEVEAVELATLLDAVDTLKNLLEYKAYIREVNFADRLYAELENLRKKYSKNGAMLTYEEEKAKPDVVWQKQKWSDQLRKVSETKDALHAKLGLPRYILASEGLSEKQIRFYNDMMWAAKRQQDYDAKEKQLKLTLERADELEYALSQNDRQDVMSLLKGDSDIAFDAYEHLFGEVEARDVEARRTLLPQERSAIAPYSLTGIKPENYAVSFDGTGPATQAQSRTTNDKFARPMRMNKTVEPLTIDDLTPEELFNSLNAYDILKGVTDNYLPTSLSLDDLQAEAALRGVPVSAIQKLALNPGDFTVKMFQYDTVARKLNDRVATLAEKINSGRYTAKDKSDFLKASLSFEDVTAKIFGLQSEYGRALRAIQEMEYTNKKIRTYRDALKGLTGEAKALEGMDDPATFEKFARKMSKTISLKAQPAESSLGDAFASALNTPRAIMSSFDLSAPMRQGVFFIGRREYYSAWSSMFSGVRAEKNYTDMMKDVMRSEYYPLMSVGKLFISSLDGDLSSREESFQSDFAKNVPGVRRSEVAYAAFLNKLRTDLFANYVKTFEEQGYELATKVDPKTGERVKKALDELSEKEVAILKGLGNFINAGTGRGNLTVGDRNGRISKMIQAAGPLMNAMLFSPGLIASRIRLLNPVWYARLPGPVRKQAIKEGLKFFPGMAMTLGLINLAAQAMGEEEVVEWDLRSSNFLKVNVGGTRYDIMGGMAQYMTLFTKGLVHFSNMSFDTDYPVKKTSTGGLARYEDDFRGGTFLNDFMKFSRYKLSPMASFIIDAFDGKNAVGEPFTLSGAIGDRMMPLYLQDLMEIAEEEDGLTPTALASALPGFFGVGVSRYTPQPLDAEQELEAPDGWDDKTMEDGENAFVTIREGQVILKPNAQRMYKKTVNAFFQEIMQEQVAYPDWPDLTPKEQAEIIEEAKRIARQETKKYIKPYIGIEDAPIEEEEEEFEE